MTKQVYVVVTVQECKYSGDGDLFVDVVGIYEELKGPGNAQDVTDQLNARTFPGLEDMPEFDQAHWFTRDMNESLNYTRQREPEPSQEYEFTIHVREVHVQPFTVVATSEREAMDAVQRGDAHVVDNGLEYSHALDREHWTVESKLEVGPKTEDEDD